MREQMLARAAALGFAKRLHLPGTTDAPGAALSAMDVFMLASGMEGTPNVVLEASLIGLPIVATDAGGTAETIDEGVTGFVVPQDDAALLGDRVTQVLRDPSFRSGAAEAGPAFIRARYGLERMIAETAALYEGGADAAAAAPARGVAAMTEPAGRGAALKRHAMLALKVGVTIACFALLPASSTWRRSGTSCRAPMPARSSRRWR